MPSATTHPATSPSSIPPTDVASAERRGRRLRRLAQPIATGVALALAFEPVGWWPLALVAPIPLLLAWRDSTPRRAAADAFVAGGVFFGILVAWTWYFGAVAYVPFVAALAAYWAVTGAIVGAFATRGLGSPWVVASVWVFLEALRGRFPLGGFSWGEVGYAFHDVAAMRSVAAWGGVLSVSFVAVLFAGYGARLYSAYRDARSAGAEDMLATIRRPVLALAAVAVVVAAAHATLPGTEPGATLRVGIVQGNGLNRDLTTEERRARYLPTRHFELAERLDPPLDMVVLPESSLDEDPRDDPFLEANLRDIALRLDAHVLTNAAVEIEDGRRLHNTNFLYGPAGALEGTYIKQHLVPFGEYVPGRSFLEGLVDELEQIPRDHAPGDQRRIFDVAGVPVANLICFESAFTEIARAYAGDGAQVLMVSTNNRSFRRSANSAQHIGIGQMRAAETGRPVVQAAISGQSAFIDHEGRVLETTSLFEEATLERSVEGRTGSTPYVVLGDWILILSGLILIGAALHAALGERGIRFAGLGASS